MAYRTSRRTSRFRRRPSRRYSRRPLRRTFKRARPSCGRRVTLDHRELQGRTTLDLLSYLPGLSGSHGKVFSFFGYLSVANTLVFQLVFPLARAWVLSLRLSLATGCCPQAARAPSGSPGVTAQDQPFGLQRQLGPPLLLSTSLWLFWSQRLTSLGLFQ